MEETHDHQDDGKQKSIENVRVDAGKEVGEAVLCIVDAAGVLRCDQDMSGEDGGGQDEVEIADGGVAGRGAGIAPGEVCRTQTYRHRYASPKHVERKQGLGKVHAEGKQQKEAENTPLHADSCFAGMRVCRFIRRLSFTGACCLRATRSR